MGYSATMTSSTIQGVTSTGLTVTQGGTLIVENGGVLSASTVSSAGYIYVSNGGTAAGITVSAGGTVDIYNGGTLLGATLHDSGTTSGVVFVSSGGYASGVIVSSGAKLIEKGGTVSAATVLSGGRAVVSSAGNAFATVVSHGGFETVSNGGTAYYEDLLSGGSAYLSNGGTDSGATINSGAVIDVYAGGTLAGTDLVVGGRIDVTDPDLVYVSGGAWNLPQQLASSMVFSDGTTAVTLTFSGVASNVFVSATNDGGGGTMISAYAGYVVSGGQTTSGLQLGLGQELIVESGGDAVAPIVANGAREYVLSGGLATSGTIDTGAGLYGSNGGTVIGETITGAEGAFAYVYSGGTMSNAVVDSGAVLTEFTGDATTGTQLMSGGTLDFLTLNYSAGATVSFDSGTDTLTISSGPVEYTRVLGGSYTGLYFHVGADNSTGTDVTLSATPCFARGTRIATARGEIAVEALAIGEAVITARGEHRPIKWIGHRRVDCARHPRPAEAWPIRIAAGAFAEASPVRDLFVSPEHAICVAGQLVRANLLLNDATIRQMPVPSVEYWHVELESHDVLVSEGLAAESYLELGNRQSFENAETVALHADFAPQKDGQTCLPVLAFGPGLIAIRASLLARARLLGHRQTDNPDLHILADGAVLRPVLAGDVARFAVPGGTRDLRIVSRAIVPSRHFAASEDSRRLGLPIGGIALIGADGVRHEVALDGDGFGAGWHAPEFAGAQRWTQGEAALQPTMWEARARDFTLELTLLPHRFRAWLDDAATEMRKAG